MPPDAMRRVTRYRSGRLTPCCSKAGIRRAIHAALPEGTIGRTHPQAMLAAHGQGLSLMRQGPRVRTEPESLDGRDQAPLQPEPSEGPDHGWLRAAQGVRLH